MELLAVNFDTQTELYKRLMELDDFKEFFIEVSKEKTRMDFEELKILRMVVKSFALKFGADAVTYLSDSITTEMTLPCKSVIAREENEAWIKKQIVNNFEKIFPDYTFVQCEKQLFGIGKVDIYAMCGERSVIIELKTGNKSPNSQLLAYGSKFENPILIGITEDEISEERKLAEIKYYTLEELKKGVPEWIV